MARALTVIFLLALGLYAIALFLFGVGAFGWFEQETDPLSSVFLLPLGLPWVLFVDGAKDNLKPWLFALTPLVNLCLLGVAVKAAARHSQKRT